MVEFLRGIVESENEKVGVIEIVESVTLILIKSVPDILKEPHLNFKSPPRSAKSTLIS